MARKRLTDSGMRNLKSTRLKEGHTYFMGASSSPKLIYVEDVGTNKVTYRTSPFYPEDKKTRQKDIIQDLVAQGNETMRNSPRSKWIDRDTKLREIQRSRIKFKIKQNSDLTAREVERKYRRKYGLETNMGQGNRTYVTTVNKENVSKIRDLPDIRVLESSKP